MRPRVWPKQLWAVIGAVLLTVGLAAFAFSQHATAATGSGKAAPPATTLGIYTTDEDNTGQYPSSWPDGQQPDVANDYLQWGQAWPSSFVSAAQSAGVTPYVELEPWETGPNWSGPAPQFSNISANGDASDSDCINSSGSYTESCKTWLTNIGSAIAAGGKPVILTFAHEFNVSGQYPWAQGDTGSCGSSACTPAQWIAAWDEVVSVVNASANGLAYWMWAPNADTGGTTIDPSPYWPGASEVDMVGVDGYPTTEYGASLGTFSGYFGTTFAEIKKLTSLPIFLSETNLAQMVASGGESIPNFISDMCSNGGDGFLEFDDANWGLPSMSSAQWAQADTAMASDCATTGGGTPTPTPSPTPTPTGPNTACQTAAPTAAPTGLRATVNGSSVVLNWTALSNANDYEVAVYLPNGQLWRESVTFVPSATYDVVPTTGTYTYKISGLNNIGPGPWSSTQSFTVTS